MNGTDLVPLAVGHMIGLGAIGSCLGIGVMAAKYLESSARQPELMDKLQGKVFLLVGVLDGAQYQFRQSIFSDHRGGLGRRSQTPCCCARRNWHFPVWTKCFGPWS